MESSYRMYILLAMETAWCTFVMYSNASGLIEHITFYSNFRLDLWDYNIDYGCRGYPGTPRAHFIT
jgi:hypothetical protein